MIDESHAEVERLLLAITRCPIVAACRAGTSSPCSSIVGMQTDVSDQRFSVPEPWSGDIRRAPLLFVSSNPSIDDPQAEPREAYPTPSWQPRDTIDFFEHRFGGGRTGWTDRRRTLMEDGSYSGRSVKFWDSINARASELIDSPVIGWDFALTEVVHCKSWGEIGAWEALDTCSEQWLEPVLDVSGARVIVALGEIARTAMERRYGRIAEREIKEVDGGHRVVVRLPHPNRRGVAKSFASWYSADQLDRLKVVLMGADYRARAGIDSTLPPTPRREVLESEKCAVPPGWERLVDTLVARLEAMGWSRSRLLNVEESRGRLVFSASYPLALTVRALEAVAEAQELANRTCTRCGQPGSPAANTVLCFDHGGASPRGSSSSIARPELSADLIRRFRKSGGQLLELKAGSVWNDPISGQSHRIIGFVDRPDGEFDVRLGVIGAEDIVQDVSPDEFWVDARMRTPPSVSVPQYGRRAGRNSRSRRPHLRG